MTYPPQQPDPYGNQPPWSAGHPGFAGPPPPPKPKTGLIAALIIVGILVVGGGGVGAYVLLSGDDKGSESGSGGGGTDGGDPQAVAEKFAGVYETALNTPKLADIEIEDFQPLVCAGDYRKLAEQIEGGREGEKTASARPRPEPEEINVGVKDVQVDGDSGTFKLTGTRKSGKKEKDRPLDLERKDGEWRVCGLFKKREDDDGSGPTTTKRKPLPTLRPSS